MQHGYRALKPGSDPRVVTRIQQAFDLIKAVVEGCDGRNHGGIRGLGAGPLAGHLTLQMAETTVDSLQSGGQGKQAGLPFVQTGASCLQVAAQLVHQPFSLQLQGIGALLPQVGFLPAETPLQRLHREQRSTSGFQKAAPRCQVLGQAPEPLTAELHKTKRFQMG